MHFDHIVIGLGSMGSSTLYQLAKRGKSVLGIEQFHSPHDQGSHGGQSRIIRMAYYEHPDYIPLLQKAYLNWEQIEKECSIKLFHRTGLYYAGPSHNDIIQNVKKSAAEYHIELKDYEHKNITVPAEWESFIEPNAGFLRPALAISTYLAQAEKYGAAILQNTKVLKWELEGKLVKIVTDKGSFFCKKVIFTVGPWTASLLNGIERNLSITRQILAWIRISQSEKYIQENFPCWFIMDNNRPGAYYGFPWLSKNEFGEYEGLKLAYHYPGEITDVHQVKRDIDSSELKDIKEFVRKYFQVEPEIAFSKTCFYSNTPDEHFVIDNMPGMEEHVCFAWGFSGHGFKFVSVVGEILADLAENGWTALPIDFLNANRFTK